MIQRSGIHERKEVILLQWMTRLDYQKEKEKDRNDVSARNWSLEDNLETGSQKDVSENGLIEEMHRTMRNSPSKETDWLNQRF